MTDFTHFNDSGRAKMVDVGEKAVTERIATAGGKVLVNPETFRLIKEGGMKKGDVLGTAQISRQSSPLRKHPPSYRCAIH